MCLGFDPTRQHPKQSRNSLRNAQVQPKTMSNLYLIQHNYREKKMQENEENWILQRT